MIVLTNTKKQSEIYRLIESKPGENPILLASLVGTSVSGFSRIVHALMKMGLVYSKNGKIHKEWYVLK